VKNIGERVVRAAEAALERSGDPGLERIYRTRYLSPDLPETEQEALRTKLSKPPQRVVVQVIRNRTCSECGAGLPKDPLICMEGDQTLCIACARLDDPEYLHAGGAALTCRATKYTTRMAVVVRFSRSRGRYERQAILVEPAALGKAEHDKPPRSRPSD
jgi:hypothetical protein